MYLKNEFLGIQGEGRYRGELSIFFQFTNISTYTKVLKDNSETLKNKESIEKSIKKTKAEDVFELLLKYPLCKNVVITGIDNLIMKKNEDIIKLLTFLKLWKYKITIEVSSDLSNISPTIFSDIIFSILLKNEADLNPFLFENKNNYVKVFFKNEDVSLDYLKKLNKKGLDVFVMPNSTNCNDISFQRFDILGFCIKNGFNYTEKDHINIFKDNYILESVLLDNMRHGMNLGKPFHVF